MTASRTHRILALALSLVMTLSIFSGVTQLASPELTLQWLVQQTGASPLRG